MSRKTDAEQMLIGGAAATIMLMATGAVMIYVAVYVGFWASMAAGIGACMFSAPLAFIVGFGASCVRETLAKRRTVKSQKLQAEMDRLMRRNAMKSCEEAAEHHNQEAARINEQRIHDNVARIRRQGDIGCEG